MTIGIRIRELRKNKGWTQKQLADKINVSPQVVSNWERSYTAPDSNDIARLSLAFDVQADYILSGNTTEFKAQFELSPQQLAIFQEMNQHPKFKVFFNDLAKAPQDKILKLIKMWDIIKEDIENDDDEEPEK